MPPADRLGLRLAIAGALLLALVAAEIALIVLVGPGGEVVLS